MICFFWDSEFESNESRDRSLIVEVAPSHLKLDFPLINFFGVQLLYEAVLVSVVQLSDSAVCLPYIPPPPFLDFLPI